MYIKDFRVYKQSLEWITYSIRCVTPRISLLLFKRVVVSYRISIRGSNFNSGRYSSTRKRAFHGFAGEYSSAILGRHNRRVLYHRFVILTFPIEMVFGMLARAEFFRCRGIASVTTQFAVKREPENRQTVTNIVFRELCRSQNRCRYF